MKKAAKVFLIIGMVLGCYFVFPIVLGILTIKRINRAKTIDELRTWGIISLIFVSILGGIFVLCIKENELVDSKNELAQEGNGTGYDPKDDPSEKLRELKALYDDGIIDLETYKDKRETYVEEL